MKGRILDLLIGLFLAVGFLMPHAIAAEEAKITRLNPRGTPPPIRLVPMPPRLDTLNGKTIYVINIGFGEIFLPEVQKVLSEKYPQTKWIFKRKGGRDYFAVES